MFLKAWADISLTVDFHKSSANNSTTQSPVQHSTIILEFLESHGSGLHCNGPIQSPSPFEALAGLFWKLLNLDQGFFRNCMVYNKVNGEGLSEVKLSKAAMAIRNVLEKIDIEAINDQIESIYGHIWARNGANAHFLPHRAGIRERSSFDPTCTAGVGMVHSVGWFWLHLQRMKFPSFVKMVTYLISLRQLEWELENNA
ncbi:hypothetical protein RJ641_006060 [Dillenia turbinata]|uniref:Uncharacterized protein n=1 Tax=Dillenia turbinata TaxID=194707 RepID=A0AAN8V9I1_9MAGN